MDSPELRKLAAAAQRHADADGEFHTAVPRLTLYRSSAPTEHNAVVYVPSLCVIVQGAKEVVVGGEAYRYDPARALLVAVDMPAATRVVEASYDRPCLAIRIEVDAAEVGEFLAEGASVPSNGPPSRGIGVTAIDPQLMGAIMRLVALLDTPNDIGPLSPLVLREITYRLLTSAQGARLRQIVAPGAPAQRIARAIAWLKVHYAEPARIEGLAKYVALRAYPETAVCKEPGNGDTLGSSKQRSVRCPPKAARVIRAI